MIRHTSNQLHETILWLWKQEKSSWTIVRFEWFRLPIWCPSYFHRFSIGIRSGDWAGHFSIWILFDTSQSFTTFNVCLGSLLCWNNHSSSIKLLKYEKRLFFSISLYFGMFIIPSMRTSGPSTFAENTFQTLLSPCLTRGIWYLLSYCEPTGCRTYPLKSLANKLNFDSSKKVTLFQFSEVYSQCCLAKSNWASWFSILMKGFLIATRPIRPIPFRHLKTVCQLTVTWFSCFNSRAISIDVFLVSAVDDRFDIYLLNHILSDILYENHSLLILQHPLLMQ